MTGKWIDISQPLQNNIAEWPGDTPFSYEVAYSKAETGFSQYWEIDDEYAYGNAYRRTVSLR